MADVVHHRQENPVPRSRTESRESLESMNKKELTSLAERLGISVEGTGSRGGVLKKDLIEALATD